MGRKKNKEYYAVIVGRVDEPTIYSSWYVLQDNPNSKLIHFSWGDAHPRVIGCKATQSAFHSIEEARRYMERNGILKWKEVIKETALDTTPAKNSTAYYAVAHGRTPGIKTIWYGEVGALEDVHEFKYACHKHFRTKAQAEAFLEDWKEAYAEVVRRAVRQALDWGCQPHDMKLNLDALWRNEGSSINPEDIAEQFKEELKLE